MKAKLLASATQRSAVMERMQNVASTSAAATKPIPSMTDRSLIRLSFRLRWTLQHARGGLTLFAASLASRWQLTSDLGTAALGLARQLSRTGAARLTDVHRRRARLSQSRVRTARKIEKHSKIGHLLRYEQPWLRRNLVEP